MDSFLGNILFLYTRNILCGLVVRMQVGGRLKKENVTLCQQYGYPTVQSLKHKYFNLKEVKCKASGEELGVVPSHTTM